MEPTNKPELLAPVSGPDALSAALASGVDAVYLGLRDFNARRKARNFTAEELRAAVQTCRRAGCRVYLTFNTLIFEDEWNRARRALGRAQAAGVDALIVQDLGAARVVRQWLPEMPLHASTQMTVHHPSQLKPLAEAGFARVIVARECSLEEVDALVREGNRLGLGMEVFAHGALCVSYSGQCLISAFLEGRSGNRGLCAQICRRPFRVVTGKKRGKKSLPLSMKDLSALPVLADLVAKGVASLKLEGRLKRPEYTAAVVGIYREALDRIEQGQAGPFADLEERLALVYNRGFSLGGLGGGFNAEETTGQWGGPRFQRLGKVLEVDRKRDRLRVAFDRPPEPGDGLALFPPQGGIPFTALVTRNFPMTNKMGWLGIKSLEAAMDRCPGEGVLYLSSSAAQLREIRDRIRNYEPPRLNLGLRLAGEEGQPLRATACLPGSRAVTVSSTLVLKEAGKHPLDSTVLAEQFGRLGNTPYHLADLKTEGLSRVFLPMRELNRMRRQLIEALEQDRLAPRELPPTFPVAEEPVREVADRSPGTRLVVLGQHDKLDEAWAAGAEQLLYPAEEALSKGLPALSGPVWLWVPAITPSAWFQRFKDWLAEAGTGVAGLVGGHLGSLNLARQYSLPFRADTPFNLANTQALKAVKDLGAIGAALSWELTPDRILALVNSTILSLEVVLLGRPPLMESALKNPATGKGPAHLLDDQGRAFPLRPGVDGQGCRIEAPFFRMGLSLIPRLKGKIDLLRLDLRALPQASCAAVVRGFREALEHPSRVEKIHPLIEAETATRGGIEKDWAEPMGDCHA